MSFFKHLAITKDVFGSGLWEAHHVIPKNVLGYLPELQDLLYDAKRPELRFEFAGEEKGMLVQRKI